MCDLASNNLSESHLLCLNIRDKRKGIEGRSEGSQEGEREGERERRKERKMPGILSSFHSVFGLKEIREKTF
jgi:hypothetical protein